MTLNYYKTATREEIESRIAHLKRLEKQRAKLLVRTTWPPDVEPIKAEMLKIAQTIEHLEERLKTYEEE